MQVFIMDFVGFWLLYDTVVRVDNVDCEGRPEYGEGGQRGPEYGEGEAKA